ncbi:hypothetical protein BX600DRAFT_108650 [Xylariales sp. PMI_506]|nr:hypothetical protein BX600DRAFT_108650 [Xylariales sp. PMI_506]
MKVIVACILALGIGASAWSPWDGGYPNGDGYDGSYNPFGENSDGSDDDGDGTGFGKSAGFAAGSSIGLAMYYRNIHGILAAAAMVGFFPVGAIMVRIVPGRLSWILHAITQIMGYSVYIAAAALGIYLTQMVRIPPNQATLLEVPGFNVHPIIGIAVLAALFFQPALGWIHHVRFKRLRRRTGWSHLHIWVGRLAITLGIINGGIGLQLAGAPSTAKTAYAVVASIMWLVWVLAAIYSAFRRSKNDGYHGGQAPKGWRRFNSHGESTRDGRHDPSPPYSPGPMYGRSAASGRRVTKRGGGGEDMEMHTGKPTERDSVSLISSRHS